MRVFMGPMSRSERSANTTRAGIPTAFMMSRIVREVEVDTPIIVVPNVETLESANRQPRIAWTNKVEQLT